MISDADYRLHCIMCWVAATFRWIWLCVSDLSCKLRVKDRNTDYMSASLRRTTKIFIQTTSSSHIPQCSCDAEPGVLRFSCRTFCCSTVFVTPVCVYSRGLSASSKFHLSLICIPGSVKSSWRNEWWFKVIWTHQADGVDRKSVV